MKNEKLLIVLAFIAVYIIWGSSYLFNKILVQELPPFELAGIRFLVAGILIFLFALIRKMPLSITKKQFQNVIIAGFLFLVMGNGILVWGLKYLDSGFTALIIAGQPLNILLMLWIWKGQKIKGKSLVGVFLGLLGIYLLMSGQELGSNFSWTGVILVLVSMMCWGIASLFVTVADLPKNQFINSAYQMVTGGISMIALSPIVGEKWVDPLSLSVKGYISWAFLIIFASIIAFSSFNYLLKKVSAEKVATSAYVNPLVAIFLGYIVLDERLNFLTIIASLILLVGVYFVNSTKEEKSLS